MDVRSQLRHLIEPETVAIVGASERPGSLGEASLRNLLKAGYSGRIYPINPKYETLLGVPCYNSWRDIPETVECAIICTPARTVAGLVEEAGKAGARSAIVFASGFAETGAEGHRLQAELREVAASWGMALCGPNCLGLVNFPNGFMGFGAPMSVDMSPGRIAAVCQSGSVAIALLNSGRGLQYRSVVSSGNEAVVSIEDYLEFFVEDGETDTIMAFVEGFRNVPKLRQVAARAQVKGKPLIVLKVGRSAAGRQAAIAHTGALAGADNVLKALFQQLGIVSVMDLDEMFETATLFQTSRRPRGKRLGVIGISGGEVGMLADMAEDAGLELAQLADDTLGRIKGLLPPFSNVSNPLDAWGIGDLGETYAGCLRQMIQDPGVDIVAVTQDSQAGLGVEQAEFYTKQAHSVVAVHAQSEKPIVLFSNVSGGFHPELRRILDSGHVPALQGTRESLRAIHHLIGFCQRQATAASPAIEPAGREKKAEVGHLLTGGSLPESAGKQLLAAFGLPVTREMLVTSLDQARQAASKLGYPIVLKVDSADIQHKSDVGAVRLGISDELGLIQAYTEMLANVEMVYPRARINGILVQEMLDLRDALEVIVGVTRDPQCGPALLFGLGGVLVEVLKDVAIRIAPLSSHDAWEMLAEIRGARILDGIRGKPALDKQAIVDVLLKLSDLAIALDPNIVEIDINPLIVFPEGRGAVAADALVVTAITG